MSNNFVIDANLLFSAVLSGKDFYQNLVLNYKFYAPDFCLTEIKEYEDFILKKTKLKKDKLKEFTLMLFSNITIVPHFLISNESFLKAFDLCKDVDENDTVYLALSIELNLPLITRDKKLKDGLSAKGFNSIITFDDFAKDFFDKNK